MIHAVTFDFWNTLFEARSADGVRVGLIQGALKQAGHAVPSASRIEKAIGRAWKEWDRVWEQECRTFGAQHWTALVLADLRVSLSQGELGALVHAIATSGMQARPPLVEGVSELLPRLAERYRVGLICDTGLSPGWMLRRWMDAHGILGHFVHLTFSDELGVSKPHPDPFLNTLCHLGVSPEASVHVGDYPRTDVAGARGVGMRAIRFAGVYDWGDGAVRADAAIQSYSQLEPLLERWSADSLFSDPLVNRSRCRVNWPSRPHKGKPGQDAQA